MSYEICSNQDECADCSGAPRTGNVTHARVGQSWRGIQARRTRGGRCRTPGIKFNQHHNLHAIAQRFHRGGDSSTRDTKSPFKLPR